MGKFDFDLEEAQIELECVNNLLGIFDEFCDDECPSGGTSDMSVTSAVVFCIRAQQYVSLISTARDKINQLTKQMDTAVKSYCEARKGGVA